MPASTDTVSQGVVPDSTSQSGPSSHFSIDLNALPRASGLDKIIPHTAQATPTIRRDKPTASASPQPTFAISPEGQHRPGGPLVGAGHVIASRTSPPPHGSMAMALGRSSSPISGATSPHRGIHSGSPRHLSPATSQIFERDVQEDVLDPGLSSAIPHHIQTENHIPPVLEAASTAITDSHLNPEDVEIVMSSAHQPAAATVGGSNSSLEGAPLSSFASYSEHGPDHEQLDAGSTYGNVDPTDLRRLSFISFADVVHAEHAHDSLHGTNTSSLPPPASVDRSPSPRRLQPGSSNHTSLRGPPAHGELTIETLQQTLDRTGIERSGSVSQQHPLSFSTTVAE